MSEFIQVVVGLIGIAAAPTVTYWIGVQEGRREAYESMKQRKLIYDRNVLRFKKR